MATYQKQFSSGWATLILSVTESNTSSATNTGKISWSLKVQAIAAGASWNDGGASITVDIGGTRRYNSDSFDIRGLSAGSSKAIASGSFNATHKADGTLSLAVAAKFDSNVGLGDASISGTFTGTTIPRATTPSVSPKTVTLGNVVTISTPRASSSFTHRLYYRIGSGSWISIASGVTTSYKWTVPISIANSFPTKKNGNITIRCDTYSGSNKIGNKTCSLGIVVPDGNPAVSVAISEAVKKVTEAFGNRYVQGLSQINVTIDADGVYGSTIKTYKTVIDGVSYNASKFTSNVISGTGSIDVTTIVTDSRGETASKKQTINVVPYSPPIITALTYRQCDEDGTENPMGNSTKVTISGVVASVDNQNSRALTLKWRNISDASYQTRNINLSDYTFTVTSIVTNTSIEETYEFVAVLSDKITAITQDISTGTIAMSLLAGGKGVTFGAEASEEGVVISENWPFLIDDSGLETLYNEVFG